MPFADETTPVRLVAHQESWADDFTALRSVLARSELADVGSIEHIGSTAVPGLAAKDVIDVQIRLTAIDRQAISDRLTQLGFRRRP